ncbi:MAG: hypothetical protein HXX19_05155 [Rhodoferax sp.]|nr:hypothetical protein [Rhodoferax sp.]
MTSTRTALFSALLLAFSFGASAAPLTKVEYKTGKTEIAATLKAGKLACDAQTGNAKDICIEEAKGVEKVALAELQARYEPSTKHNYEIAVAKAKAAFAVAKEKCDDQTGNPKDVCRKEADANYTAAMAEAKLSEKTSMNDAKAAEKISDAKTTAMDKNASAQKTASTDIRDADYKTAIEKCDAFAGDVKAKCVTEAKTRFGK